MTLAAVAVLTLLAGGGGWFLGGDARPEQPSAPRGRCDRKAEPEARSLGKKDEGFRRIATEANGVVQLEPITTNLAYPTENWITARGGAAVQGRAGRGDGRADPPGYRSLLCSTVSLQQIQGPRGFQYLKDDIEERVDLRSEGRVTNVMFRTFVVRMIRFVRYS